MLVATKNGMTSFPSARHSFFHLFLFSADMVDGQHTRRSLSRFFRVEFVNVPQVTVSVVAVRSHESLLFVAEDDSTVL